jgi:hypothetical protein
LGLIDQGAECGAEGDTSRGSIGLEGLSERALKQLDQVIVEVEVLHCPDDVFWQRNLNPLPGGNNGEHGGEGRGNASSAKKGQEDNQGTGAKIPKKQPRTESAIVQRSPESDMGRLVCCERSGVSRANRLDRIVSDTVILTGRSGQEAALLPGGGRQFRAAGPAASSDEDAKVVVEAVSPPPIIEEEEEEDAGTH